MIRKINTFLNNTFKIYEHDDREGSIIIWNAIIAFVVLFVGQFILHNVALWFSILCLGVTFAPPVIEGIRAISKKDKFNPKNWFLCIEGLVFGGMLACLVIFVVRGIVAIISAI